MDKVQQTQALLDETERLYLEGLDWLAKIEAAERGSIDMQTASNELAALLPQAHAAMISMIAIGDGCTDRPAPGMKEQIARLLTVAGEVNRRLDRVALHPTHRGPDGISH